MFNIAPKLEVIDQIVFNAQPQNVDWVFVDGRVLKRNGKLVGVNVEDIVEKAQKVTDHVHQLLFP